MISMRIRVLMLSDSFFVTAVVMVPGEVHVSSYLTLRACVVSRLKREEERLQKEIKEREDEEARKILEDARKKGRGKGIKDVSGMGKDQILNEVMTEAMKARQEAEAKLNRLIKTMDHFERARREEETPLLAAAYEKKVRYPPHPSLFSP